jgi:hypothetical protein
MRETYGTGWRTGEPLDLCCGGDPRPPQRDVEVAVLDRLRPGEQLLIGGAEPPQLLDLGVGGRRAAGRGARQLRPHVVGPRLGHRPEDRLEGVEVDVRQERTQDLVVHLAYAALELEK